MRPPLGDRSAATALARMALRLRRALRLGWRALGRGFIEFYRSSNLTFASSIAYYTLLSMFPFLWIVATILGKLAVSRETLLPVVQGALPRDLEFLISRTRDLAETPLELSVAGTILLLWAAMGVFGAVTSAVNHAWGVENPLSFFKHKLVAFVIMMASGIVLVSALFLMSAMQVVEARWFAGVLRQFPGLADLTGFVYRNLPTPLIILAIGLIYYYVPNVKVRLRDVWVGAVVAGLLWRGALKGFGWFMRDPQRLTEIHGSIAAVIVFLLWVYLSAIILLYGVEVTAAYARLRQHLPADAPGGPARD